MTDYQAYWRDNTFDIAERVQTVRTLLKTSVPVGASFARYGTATDGGYILATDLDGLPVISCGVDDNVDFECALAAEGCTVQMFDYSIDALPKPVPNGTFTRAKIGVGPGDVLLDSLLTGEVILKMDIEGSEWDVLADSMRLGNCRQIVMEAHWMLNLPYDAFYLKVEETLINLRKTHTPVWVHANNDQPLLVMGAQPIPNVFEVLFLNNNHYEFVPIQNPFVGLTTPNNPAFPEIGLSFP